jgi:hypothetical protein
MTKALRGFESGLPLGCDPWELPRSRANLKLFPVPELVLFALREVMGFQWSGVGEKVRWSVYATVEGEPFVFELRKFGFTISHRKEVPLALLRRVEGQLSSSLRLLEPLLDLYAKAQLNEGNLTMANKMGEFDSRYEYFRGLADQAFAPVAKGNDPDADQPNVDDFKILDGAMAALNRQIRREKEGYFCSAAMVDAYFSRLEHRVLLLRAFCGRPLAEGEFGKFLGLTWDARLKEVVDIDADQNCGKLLGRLREVKATIRNPMAHGGVENDGGAYYFHMPRIGAIPANLSRYRGRLRMSFFPIADATHLEVCDLFDEVDAMLTQGVLELPNEFVKWGIDPQFDTESVARYAEAVADGAQAVEGLVERLGHEWERHTNMDY